MELSYNLLEDDFLSISVDGTLWKTVPRVLFGERPTLYGNTFEELETSFQELERQKARDFILRKLNVRPLLVQQVKDLLEDLGVTSETIEAVVEECVSYGYLNDAACMEGMVRRSLRQKDGPSKILRTLKSRGASQEDAEEAVEEFCDEETQETLIKRLLETRYKNRDITQYHVRQNVIAALVRKGFSLGVVCRLLK